VIKAARQLAREGIAVDVFSITSWSALARDGRACHEATNTDGSSREPFITGQLARGGGPIVAATDYVHAVPESIRAYIPGARSYRTLGTDGFGRSDTRAALREFFRLDARSIVQVALAALGATSGY